MKVRGLRFCFGLLATIVLACKSDDVSAPTPPTPPPIQPGALAVTVSTRGGLIDADGYDVVVSRASSSPFIVSPRYSQHVDANGTVVFVNLTPDRYNVGLLGVAPQCLPQQPLLPIVGVTAIVNPAETQNVLLAVTCFETRVAGSLTVTVGGIAVGFTLEKGAFGLIIDDWATMPIGVPGSVTIDPIVSGLHHVQLVSGCFTSVQGGEVEAASTFGKSGTRIFVPPDDSRVEVHFGVWCIP